MPASFYVQRGETKSSIDDIMYASVFTVAETLTLHELKNLVEYLCQLLTHEHCQAVGPVRLRTIPDERRGGFIHTLTQPVSRIDDYDI